MYTLYKLPFVSYIKMMNFKIWLENTEENSIERAVNFFTNANGGVRLPYWDNSPWAEISDTIYEAAKGEDNIKSPHYLHFFDGWKQEQFKEFYNAVVKKGIVPQIRGGLMLCKRAFKEQENELDVTRRNFISSDLKKLEALNGVYESNGYDMVPPAKLKAMLDLIKQMKKDGLRIF